MTANGPDSSFLVPDAPTRRHATPTPVALRRLALACVVAAVLAGIFISLAAFQRAGRLEDAAARTRQLVVLTDARSQLAAADAAATGAFLVGGSEDASGREAYLAAVDAATTNLNEASANGIGDTDAVAGISEAVGSYRGTIEYARALNRQGFPIGAAYLRTAGTTLSDQVVDPLDAEIASVRGSIRTNPPAVTVVLTTLAVLAFLVVVALTTVQLFRHSRRYVNVGVAGGAAIVGLVLLVWLGATVGTTSAVDDAVDGALSDTTQIAQARADVFDARSAENLALIARGSGQEYLERLDADLEDARARVATVPGEDGARIGQALDGFEQQLQAAADADAAGDYAAAVAIATGRDDGVGPVFDELDRVTAEVLAVRADDAVAGLTQGRPWLLAIGVAALAAGALGAWAAWAGIAQRRKEYL